MFELEIRTESGSYKKTPATMRMKGRKKRWSCFFETGEEIFEYLNSIDKPIKIFPRIIKYKKKFPHERKIWVVEIKDGPPPKEISGFNEAYRTIMGHG